MFIIYWKVTLTFSPAAAMPTNRESSDVTILTLSMMQIVESLKDFLFFKFELHLNEM